MPVLSPRSLAALSVLGFSLVLAETCIAQQPGGGRLDVYQSFPALPGGYGPIETLDIEDLNGDGIPELLIARSEDSAGGFEEAGILDVVDGASFAVLHRWQGNSEEEIFGSSLAVVDDFSGDGFADILVGSLGWDDYRGRVSLLESRPPYSTLRVWNGETPGSEFGAQVSSLGDIDGDGRDEAVFGAPYWRENFVGSGGKAYVYSLAKSQATGLQYEFLGSDFTGLDTYNLFGAAIESMGDLNGDGVPDFLVSAPGEDESLFNYTSGEVFAFSGFNGTLIYARDGDSWGDGFGSSLARVADIDNDGVDDFLAGAPFAGGVPGFWETGMVLLYSGATGDDLAEFFADRPFGLFGYSVSSADFNLDGVADFLISAPSLAQGSDPNVGVMYVYSGADHSLMIEQFGPNAGSLGGIQAHAGIDRNSDGVPEIHSWMLRPDGQAIEPMAMIHSGAINPQISASTDMISRAAGGQVVFNLEFPDEASLYWYQLLYSGAGQGPVNIQGLSVPLGYDRNLVDSYMQNYSPAFKKPSGLLSNQGDAVVTLNLPPNGTPPGLVGTTLYFAGIAKVVWGDWEYSSVSVPVTFTP
jgi:FG-GAP repeat protein